MGICDFHAIDLDKDEIIELLGQNAGMELLDYFPDGGGLSCPRYAGDVDTGAGALGNGRFEVRVYCGELLLAAGKAIGH